MEIAANYDVSDYLDDDNTFSVERNSFDSPMKSPSFSPKKESNSFS